MRNSPSKVIVDPISGVVDVEKVLPIIDTKEFQALADKHQLGMTYLVFRSATHTRFVHSIGAYAATCALGDRWVLNGTITASERDALAVYALIHDISYPAFSHVTEDFCELDDDEMTLELIRGKLRPSIEVCGVDPALVEAFASHENPLYRAVHDKNLGTEKLDYLERDGFYTFLSRPVGIQYLRRYIYFVDGKVVIDEKVVEHAIDLQVFYMKMYKGVYFRKSLVIAQRMFHKMVYRLICDGDLNPSSLHDLTDTELLALAYCSEDPVVTRLYENLRRRQLFKEAVVIRPEGFRHETRVAGKPITVFGISREATEQLVNSQSLQKENHPGVEELEQEIASVTKIPNHEILVVPVFNPERFRAQDISILGSNGEIHSLRERRPAHFNNMEETARSYTALRICTPEKYRKVLAEKKNAGKVFDIVRSLF
jgi:HD superfamily phosphohydrolase